MKNSDKIIFLDFDGVLNTEKHQKLLLDQNIPRSDKYGPLFDTEAIGNLKKILDAVPDVKLVISSSWKFEGLNRMIEMWKSRNLPGAIAGITPDLYTIDTDDCDVLSRLVGKGNEVKQWLKDNASGIYQYVIFDDLPDFLPEQEPYLILTNPITGVTEQDAANAIRILRESIPSPAVADPEYFP